MTEFVDYARRTRGVISCASKSEMFALLILRSFFVSQYFLMVRQRMCESLTHSYVRQMTYRVTCTIGQFESAWRCDRGMTGSETQIVHSRRIMAHRLSSQQITDEAFLGIFSPFPNPLSHLWACILLDQGASFCSSSISSSLPFDICCRYARHASGEVDSKPMLIMQLTWSWWGVVYDRGQRARATWETRWCRGGGVKGLISDGVCTPSSKFCGENPKRLDKALEHSWGMTYHRYIPNGSIGYSKKKKSHPLWIKGQKAIKHNAIKHETNVCRGAENKASLYYDQRSQSVCSWGQSWRKLNTELSIFLSPPLSCTAKRHAACPCFFQDGTSILDYLT